MAPLLWLEYCHVRRHSECGLVARRVSYSRANGLVQACGSLPPCDVCSSVVVVSRSFRVVLCCWFIDLVLEISCSCALCRIVCSSIGWVWSSSFGGYLSLGLLSLSLAFMTMYGSFHSVALYPGTETRGNEQGLRPPYACDFHRKISHASFIFKLI
jgi:hypothetical protein